MFVQMLSLLEVLECVEILSLPKVQCAEVGVLLDGGRLVHVTKPVDPTQGVEVSRSREVGGWSGNSARPIYKIPRRHDLIACRREAGHRIRTVFPLQEAAVLSWHQHADAGTRCVDGCSWH